MKSSVAEIHNRRERLAGLIRREGYLSVGDLSARFDVSEATVRRDLTALEKENLITRTYGGALSEYDALFSPFHQRKFQNREAKEKIARAALEIITAGDVVYLDAGSTVYAIAQLLAESDEKDLEVVTNSLPAAEVLASAEFMRVRLLGGRLLPHQLIVVGAGASLSLSAWRFDRAFLSVEGVDEDGFWNSLDEISDFQRHVCGRSESVAFCVDGSKFGRSAPSFLMPWQSAERVISEKPVSAATAFGVTPGSLDWIEAN